MTPDIDRDAAIAPAEPIAPSTTPGTVKVPPIAVPPEPVRLFNREFSWIEFNRRVLAEAQDQSVQLLERVKFLSIASNNLDEFFMVRVGTISHLVATGIHERSADGLLPKQRLRGIRERVRLLMADMYRTLDVLVPELRKVGIKIEAFADLNKKEQTTLRELSQREIPPILTPLAVDPGHPFPFLASQTLNMAILLENERGDLHVALLKVPPVLPRLIPVPESNVRFIAIESLIELHLAQLFPGLKVKKAVPFRVLRNVDIMLQEDEVQDLLRSVASDLRRRDRKEVVWAEIAADDEQILSLLTSSLQVGREDVFIAPGLLKLADLMQIYRGVGKQSMKELPF